METMTEENPIVEMRNIKKNFAAVQALKGSIWHCSTMKSWGCWAIMQPANPP